MKIPFLDFTSDPKGLEQGTEGWDLWCTKVREACESLGCFVVAYDKIPAHLREEMFKGMKSLFDLPVETKMKNTNPKPYYGYAGGNIIVPLYESLGVEDAPSVEAARAFTNLMWPDGNEPFCQIVNSMSKKMLELDNILHKMIFDSFGIEKYYNLHVESSNTLFRVMKYSAPASTDAATALPAHTDKNLLTILCEDGVHGLEVLSKEGDWVQVSPPQGSFIVLVGEALKAWSNGRFPACKHRVVMNSDRERYSCGLFSTPKDGAIVEVPCELVDKQNPLLFKPYNFIDFLYFFYSDPENMARDALKIYAGV